MKKLLVLHLFCFGTDGKAVVLHWFCLWSTENNGFTKVMLMYKGNIWFFIGFVAAQRES